MPELVRLNDERKDDGVRVQTVSMDLVTSAGRSLEALGELAFDQEIFLPIVAYAGGPDALMRTYGLRSSLPYTIAIDADGRIVDRQLGSASRARLEAMIAAALAE